MSNAEDDAYVEWLDTYSHRGSPKVRLALALKVIEDECSFAGGFVRIRVRHDEHGEPFAALTEGDASERPAATRAPHELDELLSDALELRPQTKAIREKLLAAARAGEDVTLSPEEVRQALGVVTTQVWDEIFKWIAEQAWWNTSGGIQRRFEAYAKVLGFDPAVHARKARDPEDICRTYLAAVRDSGLHDRLVPAPHAPGGYSRVPRHAMDPAEALELIAPWFGYPATREGWANARRFIHDHARATGRRIPIPHADDNPYPEKKPT